MKLNKTIDFTILNQKQKEERKRAVLEELRYLTYDVSCNDWVINRIIELVSIVAEREVILEEFKYENFISRFYERYHINKTLTPDCK